MRSTNTVLATRTTSVPPVKATTPTQAAPKVIPSDSTFITPGSQEPSIPSQKTRSTPADPANTTPSSGLAVGIAVGGTLAVAALVTAGAVAISRSEKEKSRQARTRANQEKFTMISQDPANVYGNHGVTALREEQIGGEGELF